MCTVTYLPINANSFILTHNRDEHHTRSIALLPEKNLVHGQEIIFPKDEQGGGTWIATSRNFTLCLLNGAYEKHVSTPPYKHSRGLVITDFFKFGNVERFRNEYDFSGLEPFTLIIIEHKSQLINQIVCTGTHVFHSIKNNESKHIWSSSTLYSVEDRLKREVWFDAWFQQHSSVSQDDIMKFHRFKKDGHDEGILINRNEQLMTVSLTSILKNEDELSLKYFDFLNNKSIVIEC